MVRRRRKVTASELILNETTNSTDVKTPANFQRTPWVWKPNKPSKKRKKKKPISKPEAVKALISGELNEASFNSAYWLFGKKVIPIRGGNTKSSNHWRWVVDNLEDPVVKKYFKFNKEDLVKLNSDIVMGQKMHIIENKLKGTDAVRIMVFGSTISIQVDPFNDKILRTLQDKLMTILGNKIKSLLHIEIEPWFGGLNKLQYYTTDDFLLANSINKLKERI